jgi:hypothetical protein
MKYIRDTYGVPAKRGARVVVVEYVGVGSRVVRKTGGTITGSRGAHLRIRLDGRAYSLNYHPTHMIEYLT